MNKEAKLQRFLSKLTADAEVFALVGNGVGFSRSLYKVYVRPVGAKHWWRFGDSASVSMADPIRTQRKIPIQRRTSAAWGRLPMLLDYLHDNRSVVMQALWLRARELATWVAP